MKNTPILDLEKKKKLSELLIELMDLWANARGIGEQRGQNEFVRNVFEKYGISPALFSGWKIAY